MGIEVVDSEQKFREKSEEEGVELDLTPGALDKTNDPVGMYLREMGTVPLLTREGEVEIAKRIERGKNAMLRAISRTNMAAQEVLRLGERLGAREIGVRDAVAFNEEEVTEEKLCAGWSSQPPSSPRRGLTSAAPTSAAGRGARAPRRKYLSLRQLGT